MLERLKKADMEDRTRKLMKIPQVQPSDAFFKSKKLDEIFARKFIGISSGEMPRPFGFKKRMFKPFVKSNQIQYVQDSETVILH